MFRVGLSIIFAFGIYSLLIEISLSLLLLINVFSIVVIYYSVRRGEIFGSVIGMICGLIQDSFAFGVYGVAGISKTLMGFLAGSISKKMNFLTFSRNLLLYSFLFGFELIMTAGLNRIIFQRGMFTGRGLLYLQPFCSALLAALLFRIIANVQNRRSEKME